MRMRILSAATVAAAGSLAVMAALPAAAAPATSSAHTVKAAAVVKATAPTPLPVGQSDGNLSSNALSTWQTDGVVWALAYGNGVVYVGGTFLNARPPGAANGSTTGEVSRTYLAAFNSTTGALITSFDPVIAETGSSSPGVFSLAVSPDGTTLYVGGIFNKVNGSYRDNLAAFNTSSGALTSWQPSAYGKVNAIAVAPNNQTVYIGGGFNELGTSGSAAGIQTRDYAGAVDASGNLLPWAPVIDNALTAIAVDPDDSQVLLGGYFANLNGVFQPGAGAVDPVTGTTNIGWSGANIVPDTSSCAPPAVKVITISGGVAYLGSEGTGGGCFDGDFAVTLSSSGDSLAWQNDCLGATQALVVIHGYLFKGSHAHDCAYAPGGFPQVNNASGTGWVTHHLLDQSLVDGSIGHWTPNDDDTLLGPRAMATDGNQLFLGGDFLNVNGKPQQGFAIFPAKPDSVYPSNPTTAPTATSTSSGTDTVQFPAVSSADVGTLNYNIYRDGGKTPIATLTETSWPWALGELTYQDKGLTPGSTHTYTYAATDGTHLSGQSPASASVTVASTSPASYTSTVLSNNPSFFWPLNDTTSTATDASPNGVNGTYTGGTTQSVPGPFTSSTATSFDGQSGNVYEQNAVTGPQTFSIEGWFKTSANTGGKLIGFGNSATGMSGNYDRHIYMMNDGQLVYGLYNNGTVTIETPNTYNDGQWHYVVATYDGSNMALYVDGLLTGTNSTSTAQVYNGYWRVGGDNLNGWNLDPWGSNSQGTTQPAGYYFNGTIADVAVYPTALSAAQVQAHFAAGLAQGG